jgi:hypothetical protein
VAPTPVPSAEPSDPVDSDSTSTILLILILGVVAAGLIAWIIRQRSAGTDDAGPPSGPGDDPTAPGGAAAATVVAADAPIADEATPVAVGDETMVDISTDTPQDPIDPLAADTLAADPLAPDLASTDVAPEPASADAPADVTPLTGETDPPIEPGPDPAVGDDDPTTSFRTGPGA